VKKILCCLMCLLLLGGALPALGDGVAITNRLTFGERLADIPGLDFLESQPFISGQVRELLNSCAVRLMMTDGEMYEEISVGDTPVLTFQGRRDADGGWTYISNLAPHYALKQSAGAAKTAAQTFDPEKTAARMQEIGQALTAHLAEGLDALLEYDGDLEHGEYSLDGETFDFRLPGAISDEDLTLVLSRTLRSLAADEAMGLNIPETVLQGVENFLSAVLDGAQIEFSFYGRVDERNWDVSISYVRCTVTRDGRRTYLEGGKTQGKLALHLETGADAYEDDAQMRSAARQGAEDALAVDVYLVPGDKALGIEVDVFSGVFTAVLMEINAQEEGEVRLNSRLYVGTADEPVMRQDAVVVAHKGPMPAWEEDQRQLVSLDALREEMKRGESTLLSGLVQDVTEYGLPSAAQRISQGAPDSFAAALLEALLQPDGPEATARPDAQGTDDVNQLLDDMMKQLDALD